MTVEFIARRLSLPESVVRECCLQSDRDRFDFVPTRDLPTNCMTLPNNFRFIMPDGDHVVIPRVKPPDFDHWRKVDSRATNQQGQGILAPINYICVCLFQSS